MTMDLTSLFVLFCLLSLGSLLIFLFPVFGLIIYLYVSSSTATHTKSSRHSNLIFSGWDGKDPKIVFVVFGTDNDDSQTDDVFSSSRVCVHLHPSHLLLLPFHLPCVLRQSQCKIASMSIFSQNGVDGNSKITIEKGWMTLFCSQFWTEEQSKRGGALFFSPFVPQKQQQKQQQRKWRRFL